MTTLPLIPYSQLTLGETLATTAHADVHLSTWGRAQVVVKEFRLSRMTAEGQTEFLQEAVITARLTHPHIVRLFGICNEENHYCLIIEHVAKGALQELLASSTPLTWKARLQIGSDMTSGLAFLHDQRILHRDLKSGNVLIDGTFRAKLTDFGLAKVKDEVRKKSSVHRGTLEWSAPELLDDLPSPSEKSDVYALGMTLWELTSRQLPYVGMSDAGIVRKIDRGELPPVPTETPPPFLEIIQACWQKEAAKRPTAPQVLSRLDRLQGQNFDPVPPVASSSSIAQVSTSPALVFGGAQWIVYFGDVGTEPPPPPDIEAILQSDCPFWPGKKVKDSHMLLLVPGKVNGIPLSVKMFEELLKAPKKGNTAKYDKNWHVPGIYAEESPASSYWILVTRDVIPETRGKSYSFQKGFVEEKGYQVPGILEAILAMAMQNVSGEKWESAVNDSWTLTRCKEVGQGQMLVNFYVPNSGLGLSVNAYDGGDKPFVGAAAVRKVG